MGFVNLKKVLIFYVFKICLNIDMFCLKFVIPGNRKIENMTFFVKRPHMDFEQRDMRFTVLISLKQMSKYLQRH